MAVSIFMLKKCVTSFFILARRANKTDSVKVNAALHLRYERNFQMIPQPSTYLSSSERKVAAVQLGN